MYTRKIIPLNKSWEGREFHGRAVFFISVKLTWYQSPGSILGGNKDLSLSFLAISFSSFLKPKPFVNKNHV
jgi:hypothetical protein